MDKKIYLFYPKRKGVIAPEIYGHFTEHIGGVFYDGMKRVLDVFCREMHQALPQGGYSNARQQKREAKIRRQYCHRI